MYSYHPKTTTWDYKQFSPISNLKCLRHYFTAEKYLIRIVLNLNCPGFTKFHEPNSKNNFDLTSAALT